MQPADDEKVVEYQSHIFDSGEHLLARQVHPSSRAPTWDVAGPARSGVQCFDLFTPVAKALDSGMFFLLVPSCTTMQHHQNSLPLTR